MDIPQLNMLLAVAEKGGYVQAGAHLHVSHSAIHRQIHTLEVEIDEKIFVRTGRTVQLTQVGKLLVELARTVKREISELESQIRDMTLLVSGQLRIGTGTTALMFFLPDVMERFRAKYPGVTLHIMTGNAEQVIHELRAGDLDVGIISEPSQGLLPEGDLRYEHLYSERFTVAVNSGHSFCKRKAASISELAGVPFIFFTRGSRIRYLTDRLFESAGVKPNVIMELENEEAIVKMVQLGWGAGILSCRRASSDGLHCLQTEMDSTLLNIAAVHNSAYLSRTAREFLVLCRDQAKTQAIAPYGKPRRSRRSAK